MGVRTERYIPNKARDGQGGEGQEGQGGGGGSENQNQKPQQSETSTITTTQEDVVIQLNAAIISSSAPTSSPSPPANSNSKGPTPTAVKIKINKRKGTVTSTSTNSNKKRKKAAAATTANNKKPKGKVPNTNASLLQPKPTKSPPARGKGKNKEKEENVQVEVVEEVVVEQVQDITMAAINTATTTNTKKTPTKKAQGKKRKPAAKKGKVTQGEKEKVLPNKKDIVVEEKEKVVEIVGSPKTRSKAGESQGQGQVVVVPQQPQSENQNGNSTTSKKNGTTLSIEPQPIKKGNKKKKMQKSKTSNSGVRAMVERTNKILERSRSVKKPQRKKSPIKPRILPARASARICTRKNSGDPLQGSDKPLRTVELIKRPLELRDPATKLLFLASLSIYPKAALSACADPENDATPIVIVNEEIPSISGKKPKIRSVELPLLPSYKSSYSATRAPFLDDFFNFHDELPKFKSAPKSQPSNSEETAPKKKKKKQLKQEVQENDVSKQNACASVESIVINSEEAVNVSLADPLSSTLECKPEVKELGELPAVTQAEIKMIKSEDPKDVIHDPLKSAKKVAALPEKESINNAKSTNPTETLIKYPVVEGLTISPSMNAPKSVFVRPTPSPTSSPKILFKDGKDALNTAMMGQKKTTISAVSKLESIISSMISKQEETPSLIKPVPALLNSGIAVSTTNGAPLPKSVQPKRKRKSLETIIQEIPKVKTNKTSPAPSEDMKCSAIALPNPILPAIGSQQANPIFERLLKNPMKKRNKPKLELLLTEAPSVSPMITAANPVSMTVPLQPAPANSNTLPFTKDPAISITQQLGKFAKNPAIQLPLPFDLPTSSHPGILNYPPFVQTPNPSLISVPKPKKMRKPKPPSKDVLSRNLPKSVTVFGGESTQSLGSLLPNANVSNYRPSSIHGVKSVPNIPQWEGFANNEQALDLCVKHAIIPPIKSQKKAKQSPPTKILLKPLNIEEDVPLNLVMGKGLVQRVPVIKKMEQPVDSPATFMLDTSAKQPQGSLENVKEMLARLHTKIAPAVNGVQLITIE